jgi:hypothetical protein
MNTVSIDFVAGSHGHFLEFSCNKFIAGLSMDFSPFNQLGASHIQHRDYINQMVFIAKHYSESKLPLTKKVVRISFNHQDLLLLSSVSLLRAGDYGIKNEDLHINTFHKLNNRHYSYLIGQINQAYPEITLTESSPNCPRHILREYFKFGFKSPESHGFMKKLSELVYSNEHDVFDFCFESFYNKKEFIKNFSRLAFWFGSTITLNYPGIEDLHDDFLQRQIYRNDLLTCNEIVDAVNQGLNVNIPTLTLFQESYINGRLEKMYEKEMPFVQPNYFTNTREIIKYLNV